MTRTAKTDPPVSCRRARPEATDAPARLSTTGIGSTLALARWSGRTVAFVADADDRAVQVVDVDAKTRLSTTRLDGKPSQVILLRDGRVVVALRDRGRLAVFEPAALDAPLAPRCTVATPAEPIALALTPSEDLLVAAAWGRRVAAFHGDELAPAYSVAVEREPRAIAVSSDGKTAFVAHAVGGQASVIDLATRETRRVRTEGLQESLMPGLQQQLAEKRRAASDGGGDEATQLFELASARIDEMRKSGAVGFGMRTSCQSFALARSEGPSERIFVPQVLVDPGNSEQRTPGYGAGSMHTEVPSVAVIDEKSGVPMVSSLAIGNDVGLMARGFGANEPERCLLPRAAAVDDASQTLLVACYGIDSVVGYDAMSADPAHARKRKWRVPAGPDGIAVDREGRRAVVWSQFDHALALIPLGGGIEQNEGDDDASVARIDIEPDAERQPSVAAALGRSLFHATGDQRIAHDGRACASCHPDGRDDGLVWATPNGPRRTKMLAGMLAGTAPFSWDGKSAALRDHVKETFKRLDGDGGLRSVELRALVAYIESLDPPPREAANADDDAVARGAALFKSDAVGCAACHAGTSLTDRERHDVHSKDKADRAADFDTPSLRFLAGRAPYFHDGRYRDLRALLVASDGQMGHTGQLSPADFAALEAYLRSL